jgi:hypothetical protein
MLIEEKQTWGKGDWIVKAFVDNCFVSGPMYLLYTPTSHPRTRQSTPQNARHNHPRTHAHYRGTGAESHPH